MHEMLSSEELILGVVADLHSLLNSCQVRALLVACVLLLVLLLLVLLLLVLLLLVLLLLVLLLLVVYALRLDGLNPLWPLRARHVTFCCSSVTCDTQV